MTMWENPKTRKIGKHIYHLHMEGMEKPNALYGASVIRKMGGLARIIRDERMGRYDIKNHSPYYCIYYKKEVK